MASDKDIDTLLKYDSKNEIYILIAKEYDLKGAGTTPTEAYTNLMQKLRALRPQSV